MRLVLLLHLVVPVLAHMEVLGVSFDLAAAQLFLNWGAVDWDRWLLLRTLA